MMTLRTGLLAALLITASSANAGVTQFVSNGNFASTSAPGTSFGMQSGGTVTGWNDNGGYNFLFATYTQAINPGSGITSNPGYNNNTSLYMWSTAVKTNGVYGAGPNAWTAAPSGSAFIAMDADYSTAAVSQTINGLTVGRAYTLSFDYGFAQQASYTGTIPITIAAALASSALSSTAGVLCQETYNLASTSFSGWDPNTSGSPDTCTFVASSTTEVLSFLSSASVQVPPFALFTNVSLTGPYIVPEPMSVALFGAGLVGLIGARRLRRTGAKASAARAAD